MSTAPNEATLARRTTPSPLLASVAVKRERSVRARAGPSRIRAEQVWRRHGRDARPSRTAGRNLRCLRRRWCQDRLAGPLGYVPGAAANSRHSPRTPFNERAPLSSNSMPDPKTRSFTVPETSTSPGPAQSATRAPMWTCDAAEVVASALAFAGVDSARSSSPRSASASTTARAQRIARARPSRVASRPSPRLLIVWPSKRSSSAAATASCRSKSSRQRRSPSSAARSVDRTTSVNRTVASTRSPNGLATGAGEEALDLVQGGLDRIQVGVVISAPDLDIAGAGDVIGEVAALARLGPDLLRALEDQRRDCDRSEQGADVDGPVPLHHRAYGPRRADEPLESSVPAPERLVLSRVRACRCHLSAAPAVFDVVEHRLEEFPCPAPRVVVCALKPGQRAKQHERLCSLRIRRGEHRAQHTTLRGAEQGCALRPDRIEHRSQIVHPLFQRRRPSDPVRQPRTALVERDQPRERRQPLEEAPVGRQLPRVLDLIRPAARVDKIQRTPADHLVGDAEIAAPRVTRIRWPHRTEGSQPPIRPVSPRAQRVRTNQ